MANSITIERRNKLAQILITEGSVKVGVLAERFEVSTETIRKDLIYLENTGIAKKGHGGAIASSELLERPLSSRFQENVEAKTRIAKAAVELIPDNGVIILDAGSTTFCIAKLLTLKKGLTVFTNSISAAQVLSGTDTSVFCFGGEMRGNSMSLVGLWAVNALKSIKADFAFLGTDGFLSRSGPCSSSFAEAEVKAEMLKSCKSSIVVCDSSKFRRDGMFQFSEWDSIDILISDSDAPEDKLKELNGKCRVIVA